VHLQVKRVSHLTQQPPGHRTNLRPVFHRDLGDPVQ
jgi:hypothetical protein